MHQFIGDLMASGNASKDQPDVLNAVWGLATAGISAAAGTGGGPGSAGGTGTEALGFKAASLEALTQPTPGQGKTGLQQRKGEARGRREGQRSQYRLLDLSVLQRLLASF